jgi:hypothetical protein
MEKGVPADRLETRAFGFEKNMTSEEVKSLIEADTDRSPGEKHKILKNLLTVPLANNRPRRRHLEHYRRTSSSAASPLAPKTP